MPTRCQSCGIPLSKDPKGGGTTEHGTHSTTYCSYCFQDGQFIQADITAQEMQAFCLKQMRAQGVPRFVAWLFTRDIPRLGRWRS